MQDDNNGAPAPQADARGPEGATFGKRLKAARAAARLTTKEVATSAGISTSAVNSYEAEKMTPRPEVLRRLERVLGTRLVGDTSQVVTGDEAGGPKGGSGFLAELAALCSRHGLQRGAVTVTVQLGT